MDCKCGHYQYAHDFGKGECGVKGCYCKRFRPVKQPKVRQ